MNDLLSVVMPVYNTGADLLDRSVGSLTAQTYKGLEIILVDDGSNEETAEKLDRLAEKDLRIRVIHQENKGASAARNTGIREAGGRYLAMMDADDYLSPETCEQVIRQLRRTGAGAGVFGWCRISPDGAKRDFPVIRGNKAAVIKPERLLPAVLAGDHLRGGGFPWNKVWDLSVIGKADLFDEDLFSYENKLWCVRMYQKCEKILLLPELYYTYYQAEQGLSKMEQSGRDAAVRKRANAVEAYGRMLEILPEYSAARFAAGLFRTKTILMGVLKGTGNAKHNRGKVT